MKIIDSSLNRFYTKFKITIVLLGIQTLKVYHTKHKFLMANGMNSDMDERELKFPQDLPILVHSFKMFVYFI